MEIKWRNMETITDEDKAKPAVFLRFQGNFFTAAMWVDGKGWLANGMPIGYHYSDPTGWCPRSEHPEIFIDPQSEEDAWLDNLTKLARGINSTEDSVSLSDFNDEVF